MEQLVVKPERNLQTLTHSLDWSETKGNIDILFKDRFQLTCYPKQSAKKIPQGL